MYEQNKQTEYDPETQIFHYKDTSWATLIPVFARMTFTNRFSSTKQNYHTGSKCLACVFANQEA